MLTHSAAEIRVIRMLHTQIKAAVQGVHFRINELGEIKWLARYD